MCVFIYMYKSKQREVIALELNNTWRMSYWTAVYSN